MSTNPPLVAPFPWGGGKRGVAAEVWRRFGDVRCFVEPFAGSLAVLLARPRPFSGVETVNDADGLLCNAWRGIQFDPEGVAKHADWPVSECDLHARHLWLVERREPITARLMGDPEWFDAKAAGWWLWGACAYIGSGWCSGEGLWIRGEDGALTNRKLPHLGDAGRGINRQLPHLGNAGTGINRQLPHLGDAGTGVNARGARVVEVMAQLSERLRGVRITCGDWSRVTGDSVTWRHGLCGVLLDAPYSEGSFDYAVGGTGSTIQADVRAWAIEAGKRPDMRIALCGYAEHDEMAAHGWTPHRWKARGGYGNQGGEDKNDNRHREVCWFSPSCLGALQPSLFDTIPA
jgi:hypothetical protein